MPNNPEISREKQQIREQVRSRKSTLGTALIPLSEQVTRNLETLHCFPSSKGQSLIYFVGKPQTCEIQSLPHIRALISRGLEIWLPKTIVASKSLRWGKVRDLDSDLAIGAFSVQEPTDAVIARQDIDFSLLQIAIIPGVAFDKHGHRLGYGQGYYDRFLNAHPLSCPVVGLAFEFQVFPEIRIEAYDAKVDYLVTEKKVRNFKE